MPDIYGLTVTEPLQAARWDQERFERRKAERAIEESAVRAAPPAAKPQPFVHVRKFRGARLGHGPVWRSQCDRCHVYHLSRYPFQQVLDMAFVHAKEHADG